MQPGERFSAVIHDIQPGKVTIRFPGGSLFTARSMVQPEARIGEESLFSVRENDFNGRVVLEIVKLPPEELRSKMLTSTLDGAGIPPTPEMMAIGSAIIDSGLAVEADEMKKISYLMSSEASEELTQSELADCAVFMLREKMPIEPDVVKSLVRALKNPGFLMEVISYLDLQDILVAPGSQSASRVFPASLSAFYQLIYAAAAKKLNREDTPADIKDKMRDLMNFITFMGSVRTRSYYQIPFVISGKPRLAEVHMSPSAPSVDDSVAVVVATDTENLGRVEVLINKSHGGISLQLCGDNDYTLKRLTAAFPVLSNALAAKGNRVVGADYKRISNPFTIISPFPGDNPSQKDAPTQKRYTFDMRV